jgi:hypothetical protein
MIPQSEKYRIFSHIPRSEIIYHKYNLLFVLMHISIA